MAKTNETWISSYGVSIPRIVYGTAWKKERTAGLVEQAITLGFRGIDTACQPKHYDEAGVGTGVAAAMSAVGLNRDDLYLQTKFTPVRSHDPKRIPYDPTARLSQQVTQSFTRSQLNLRTEILDCLVLHSPLGNAADLAEVWGAMEAIFDAGGTRQLGISNCYDLRLLQHLTETSRVKPVVVQNRFHAKSGYDRAIRAYCQAQDMIYQSFWTLSANPQILAHAVIRGLAQKYDRTPAQVFFRYLTQIGITPLTGTTSTDHMRQDLAIFEIELTEPERQSVGALLN